MQGQGKRLMLAVALALGVMLVWNLIFPPKEEPPPNPKTGSAQVQPAKPESQVGVAAGSAVVQPEAPRGPEEKIVLRFSGKFTATFSSYGGSLVSWKLADPRYEKNDPSKGELLPDPAKHPDTGAFVVNFWGGSDNLLPKRSEWKGTKVSDTEVRYAIETPQLALEKIYTIDPGAYLVRMTVKVTAKVGEGKVAKQAVTVSVYGYQDPAMSAEGSRQVAARVFQSSSLVDGDIKETPMADVFKQPRYASHITWTGYEHPYLLVAFAPKHAETEVIEKHTYAGPAPGKSEPSGVMQTDIVYPFTTLTAKDSTATRELVAYLGPKNYDDLKEADANAGFDTHFKSTIDLGWFAFIGRPLLWLLQKFHSVVGNWGVAIILLTFLVKVLTLYWTTKSMRSMKAMAALSPQLKAIQEKYKDDRQRIQAETMALYKQHSVNPIAGCLPILLQMPIWIALYRMLSSAGELYAVPFIPGWINDLTLPDPTYVLPIALMVTMFLQARLSPQTGDSRQQKFLQYGMPLMFGVMGFFFPAGLTIYIFTNTCLSALHSIYMNKYDKKSLAISEQLKKNQEAAKAGVPQATVKKNGKPAVNKPKPIIEATAVETSNTDDGDDDTTSATEASTGTAAQPRPRPRKKKRRR